MFIDASAIIAILNREEGSVDLVSRLEAASQPLYVSPLVRFEAVTGLARSRSGRHRAADAAQIEAARELVDGFIAEVGAKSAMITDGMGNDAIRAAQTYGKAVGHPADLNFGDCFAYACAKAFGRPLLYKGNDFALTDLA